jgi:Tfp pilus assembly protein PilX
MTRSYKSGFVLASIMMILLAMSLGMLLHYRATVTNLLMSKMEVMSATGFNAAEGALNVRAAMLQSVFATRNLPRGTGSSDNCKSNQGSDDLKCVVRQLSGFETVSSVSKIGANVLVRMPPGNLFENLEAEEQNYGIWASALTTEGKTAAVLEATLTARLITMFQFNSFYGKDLELYPSDLMMLKGPVHSTGDVYLASQKGLNIYSQLSSEGDIYVGAKHSPVCTPLVGDVLVNDPLDLRALPQCKVLRTKLSQGDLSPWNGRLLARSTPVILPKPETFAPKPGSDYWDRADLRLVLNMEASPPQVEVHAQGGGNNGTLSHLLSQSYQNNFSTNGSSCMEVGSPSESVCNWRRSSTLTNCLSPSTPPSQRAADNSYIHQPTILDLPQAGKLQPETIESFLPGGAVVGYSNSFIDRREKPGFSYAFKGARIDMLEVDVRGLLNCLHEGFRTGYALTSPASSLDDSTEGGLVIYATVKGPRSNDAQSLYGVRLRNGGELQSTIAGAPRVKGLTFISDQPVYVMGDYNAPANDEERIPASIMGDVINILSNNWNTATAATLYNADIKANDVDYNAYVPLAVQFKKVSELKRVDGQDMYISRRGRSTLQQFAAFGGTSVTGNIDGVLGQNLAPQSGGLHNFFRLHEFFADLRGVNAVMSYRGSLVSIFKPQHAKGKYRYWDSYVASDPKRDWEFEPRLLKSEYYPPMAPRIFSLHQSVMRRDFGSK